MEKQKTAVDILYKFLYEMESFEGFDPYSFNQEKVFTKAKQMEKEQIVLAASTAFEDMFGYDGTNYGLKYYNETYGKYEDKAENND